jgi:8-oxo-dGTP pyrophosphatase MutT (NUDIX family)
VNRIKLFYTPINMEFTIKPIKDGVLFPDDTSISSVFLLAIVDHTIVVTKHKKRGWDFPGGHIEKNETPLEGLRREAMEEAGMIFKNASPFVIVENNISEGDYLGKVMIGYITKEYTLVDFIPAEDVSERTVMNVDDFIENYQGDENHLKSILDSIP